MDKLDELLINLESLSGSIADAVEQQMNVELKRIQANAQRLAPVDSGHLRNSIKTNTRRDAAGNVVGTVGTALEYAPYVEFGTGTVGQNSEKLLPPGFTPQYTTKPREVTRMTSKGEVKYYIKGWIYKDPKTGRFIYTEGQPAKPFLYPAYKQNESAVRENIKKAARNALKRSGNDG